MSYWLVAVHVRARSRGPHDPIKPIGANIMLHLYYNIHYCVTPNTRLQRGMGVVALEASINLVNQVGAEAEPLKKDYSPSPFPPLTHSLSAPGGFSVV